MSSKKSPPFNRLGGFLIELVSFSTPRGIVSFGMLTNAILLVVPYSWLERSHLSLYERMHIPSPSIGLTRAYWLLLHGHFSAAVQRNKLIVVVAPVLWMIFAVALLRMKRSKVKRELDIGTNGEYTKRHKEK